MPETPPSTGTGSVSVDYFNAILHALLPSLNPSETPPNQLSTRQLDYLHAIWQAAIVLGEGGSGTSLVGIINTDADLVANNWAINEFGDFQFADGLIQGNADGFLNAVQLAAVSGQNTTTLTSDGQLQAPNWYINSDGSNNLLNTIQTLQGVLDAGNSANDVGIQLLGEDVFLEILDTPNNSHGIFGSGFIRLQSIDGLENKLTVNRNFLNLIEEQTSEIIYQINNAGQAIFSSITKTGGNASQSLQADGSVVNLPSCIAYTPTLSNPTNLTGSSVQHGFYYRNYNGNNISMLVNYRLSTNITTTNAASFLNITLPFSQSLAGTCVGTVTIIDFNNPSNVYVGAVLSNGEGVITVSFKAPSGTYYLMVTANFILVNY